MLPLLVLIGTAAAQDGATPPPAGPGLIGFLPYILIFVVFYFLLIRPQQQARKKHQEMVSNVKRGDTVVTAGGLLGKVKKVNENGEISVEIAEGVEVTAIAATLTDVRTKGEPAKTENAKS